MDPQNRPHWNPSLLGPLTSESEIVTGESRFFPGEEKFLSRKKLDEREKLWLAVAGHLKQVLDEDEAVLHVLPVVHTPPTLHILGFGIWWTLFFRAALVLTDKRLVEILMPTWDRAGTRIHSYSWGQVRKLKISLGTLTLKPAKGRTQRWKVTVRGDRKLLKLLVPMLKDLLPGDVFAPRTVPLWHCPVCGAAAEKHPKACNKCQTPFKSSSRAALLSLAFPGGGLFYVGHKVLAVLDLLGEVAIFSMVAILFMTAGTGEESLIAAVFGVFLLALTKLESVHLATVLARRTIPEALSGRWQMAVAVGAAVSLLALAVPIVLTGTFASRLDADLDLAGNTLGWSGGRDSSLWQFGADVDQRSEWTREDGQALFVFSMPLGVEDTLPALESLLQSEGQRTERKRFGGFECIRAVGDIEADNGDPLLFVRWFLFHREHADLHILSASVWPENFDALESEVQSLLETATWISLVDQGE